MASPPPSRSQSSRQYSQAARVSAGTLVIHEKRTRAAMQEHVNEAADRATAELARRGDNRRRAVVMLAILGAARWMGSHMSRTLSDERQAVRVAADQRLRRELAAAGITIGADASHGAHLALDVDAAHAESAAASLAAQWQSSAIAATARAEQPYRAIDKTRVLMRPRIERTAATEIATAYNEEHNRALSDLVERNDTVRQALEARQIVRIWSALLDRRTCDECEMRDRTEVALGDEEPPLHVSCRCILTVDFGEAIREAA